MGDFGIKISTEGIDVNDAKPQETLLSTKYPLHKLDTQNPVSFQNLSIYFNANPPDPDGTIETSLTTQIYSFPHGYDYTPTTWMMFQRNAGPGVQSNPASTKYSAYQYEGGIIAAADVGDFSNFAYLNYSVDNKNVYIKVTKVYNVFTGAPPVDLSAYALLVRIYVFVEDLVGTSQNPKYT